MIRRPNASGLVDILTRDAATNEKSTSFTVHRKDVRSVVFSTFFPEIAAPHAVESIKVQVELRAPGLDVSESAMTIKILRAADTPLLSFLVRSIIEGEQTLKVKVTCDDQELINGLLRTKFVHHGGPGGPGGPGGAPAYVQKDILGHKVLVLVEADLAVRLIRRAKKTLAAGAW